MEKESDLEDLKKDYKKVQSKYNLPSFVELNKDFNVEKIAEIQTDFLIREVRKFMADRFSNYLRFVEALLNPANAPMFVFSIVKSISNEEKNKLTEIYKKLAQIEVEIIELDLEFIEDKEAEFVKNSYKTWQEIKSELLEIIKIIKKNWNNKSEVNGKGYFG
jgi:hypothetical protein